MHFSSTSSTSASWCAIARAAPILPGNGPRCSKTPTSSFPDLQARPRLLAMLKTEEISRMLHAIQAQYASLSAHLNSRQPAAPAQSSRPPAGPSPGLSASGGRRCIFCDQLQLVRQCPTAERIVCDGLAIDSLRPPTATTSKLAWSPADEPVFMGMLTKLQTSILCPLCQLGTCFLSFGCVSRAFLAFLLLVPATARRVS
jgi:hypothetical protein